MDKNITSSTFSKYLLPLSIEKMLQLIQQLHLDRYVKKLDTITTTRLFIFAQLTQLTSYTDIHLKLAQTQKLQQMAWLPLAFPSFLASFAIWIKRSWKRCGRVWWANSAANWVCAKPMKNGDEST